MNRRHFIASVSAVAVTAGCAAPVPAPDAEADYPPLGEFVEVDGLRVHAWISGPEDTRPVVLVHGASGNLRDWTHAIAPKIAARRRVIVFDRPGFGYTDRQPAEDAWHPARQAALLREATARLGVKKPVVVGHSWGAALAMSWGLDAPESVQGLVPVSGVTMPYKGMARVFNALGISDAISWAYTEYMKSVADNGGVDRFIARAFRPQTPPQGYTEYVGAPLALRDATLRANAADIANLNQALREMEPRYASLGVPVEIVHGDLDFIGADRHASPLAERLPRAKLTLLPGVGHMAHHAAPDVLMEAIDRAAGDARA